VKQIKRKTIFRILYGDDPALLERNNDLKLKEHNTNIVCEILNGINGELNLPKSIQVLYNLSGLVQAFSKSKTISSYDKTLFIQFGLLCNSL